MQNRLDWEIEVHLDIVEFGQVLLVELDIDSSNSRRSESIHHRNSCDEGLIWWASKDQFRSNQNHHNCH